VATTRVVSNTEVQLGLLRFTILELPPVDSAAAVNVGVAYVIAKGAIPAKGWLVIQISPPVESRRRFSRRRFWRESADTYKASS